MPSVVQFATACPQCKHQQNQQAHIGPQHVVAVAADGSRTANAAINCHACTHTYTVALTMPPAALPPLPVGAPAVGPTGLPTPAPQQPKLSRGEQELSNDAADTELAKDVFGEYVCTSITFGKPHPASNITESASMCSRPLPPPRYPLRDEHFEGIIERGLLSSLQLEGVLYAGQRHSYILPGREERHAFFLGDGAGVGKGRQIAAIIYDNYCRGRRKSFWFSVTVPAPPRSPPSPPAVPMPCE